MSELDLTIMTYGEDSRRAEISLRPKIPPDLRGSIPRMNEWANEYIKTLGIDIKHIERWGCVICGKPARETHLAIASWVRLPQPKVNVYMHNLCTTDGGECYQQILNQSDEMARMSGHPPPPDPRMPKAPGVDKFPLSGSCAGCFKDETAAKESQISRCGGCKLTRYCSVTCQRGDWNRHKKICKVVKDVRWAVWTGN